VVSNSVVQPKYSCQEYYPGYGGSLEATRESERGNILADDDDRDNLLERLAALLSETKTVCFVWNVWSVKS
jgi:hypothetical protein